MKKGWKRLNIIALALWACLAIFLGTNASDALFVFFIPIIYCLVVYAFSYIGLRLYCWVIEGFGIKTNLHDLKKRTLIISTIITALLLIKILFSIWNENAKEQNIAGCQLNAHKSGFNKSSVEDTNKFLQFITYCMGEKGYSIKGSSEYYWCHSYGRDSTLCYE